MEWLICPICSKRGLLSSGITNIPQKRIVCENEYFKHFKIGEMHFLAHIQKDDEEVKFDSLNPMFHVKSHTLVLN
jgi:hypothetical protein